MVSCLLLAPLTKACSVYSNDFWTSLSNILTSVRNLFCFLENVRFFCAHVLFSMFCCSLFLFWIVFQKVLNLFCFCFVLTENITDVGWTYNETIAMRRLQWLIQATNSNTEKSFFLMFYDEPFNLNLAMHVNVNGAPI